MKKTNFVLLVVLALVIVLGGFFWFRRGERVKPPVVEPNSQGQNTTQGADKSDQKEAALEPSPNYLIRPDFSKVQSFKNMLTLQKGVSVRYGDGWMAKKGSGEFVSGGLIKTVNGRSYTIGFQENNDEYLASDGSYANNLKVYEKILIDENPHFIATSSTFPPNVSQELDYAYISSCPVKVNEACSPRLKDGEYLFVILTQNVPNAQYPVELNFTRKDDQQILAEFTEIMSTLHY